MDVRKWKAALKALPIEARCELAPIFSPSVLRAARLAERDAALVAMAVGLRPGSLSAAADAVHNALAHYASTTWRFEREREQPHNPDHASAHRILSLTSGRVPAARSLRTLFGLAKIREEMANAIRENMRDSSEERDGRGRHDQIEVRLGGEARA